MRKRLTHIALTGVALALVLAVGASGKPEVVRVGNLFLRDAGSLLPNKLPRHEQAPVAALIDGEIGTDDGSHPPAIESVIADFDKTVQIDAEGLPACRKSAIVARSSAQAKAACPKAIVGQGRAQVEVAFTEQKPFVATGPIVLFNGGARGGATYLLIHTYVAVPAPTAVVATVKITHIHRGHFGLHVVAAIPKFAGGAGSVTHFKFTIDRKFTYRGRRRSYLTASCPTGHYFAEGRVQFSDGTLLHIAHDLPCTPESGRRVTRGVRRSFEEPHPRSDRRADSQERMGQPFVG